MLLRLGLLLLLTLPIAAQATDLRIEQARLVNLRETTGTAYVLLDIGWDNAWHNDRNHDAAWVVLKLLDPEGGYRHIPIDASGHQVVEVPGYAGPAASIQAANDRTGFVVHPNTRYRGDVRWRLRIEIDESALPESLGRHVLQAYGVEMVYIPEGAFALGDTDPTAYDFGAYFRSDADGQPDGLYEVTSEAEIAIGPTTSQLYYSTGEYRGDGDGPIPAAFPKGYDAFYLMKYELRQGDYAAFLNTLPTDHAAAHFPFDTIDNYAQERGSLERTTNRYHAKHPDRALNFAAWDDQLAWSDWMACRPPTEFEFTKAARGPEATVGNSFPWGTASVDGLARLMGPSGDLVMTNGWDEDQLNDATRSVFGASFYWVMDLAGSVWERVLSPGYPDGRAYTGSHGDGTLDAEGRATNADWPHTYLEREGHGYRGGGFYEQGRATHEFNPYSPVSYRRFGAWAGANPSLAYGYRCARSADG
ncbi:MAG: hypothetical protein RhofKO_01870 [Rhodothermales bacterium]